MNWRERLGRVVRFFREIFGRRSRVAALPPPNTIDAVAVEIVEQKDPVPIEPIGA